MTQVLRAELTEQPVDLGEHEALVSHHAAGAVVSFAGVIRDHDDGRSVVRLQYSGHPSAPDKPAPRRPAGAPAIAATHRIGTLRVGDAALVAAVAADHRAAAFQTCAKLVDTIKARLPVWKHQFFADGSDGWVG